MANLTIQKTTLAGITPTYVAAGVGGDTFANNGKTILNIKNGDIDSVEVTINSATPCNMGFDHDIILTIPAGGTIAVGPFNVGRFNNATTGLVGVTYADATLVTVAAITT